MSATSSSDTESGSLTELRRAVGRIAVEILIGFVGVYAAFALTAYHDRRDQAERRRQIQKALIAEVKDLTALSRRNTGYHQLLAKFDSARKASKKPIPAVFIEPVGINMHMWEATKQSGGLNLLDVPTFVHLADFYNSISEALAYYSQLRELSVNVILPNVDRGPDAFYDPHSGALRADVERIYYRDLTALGNIFARTALQGDTLVKLLADQSR